MMSSWLINVYMDGVVREVNAAVIRRGLELLEDKWRQGCEINHLLFADDTTRALREEKLCRLVSEFGTACKKSYE